MDKADFLLLMSAVATARLLPDWVAIALGISYCVMAVITMAT